MKLFYALIFAFLSLQSWSQNLEFSLETELSKSYSKEEIAQFKETKTLPLYEYALTHACYLIDAPQGKDISSFSTIQLSKNPSIPSETFKDPIVFTDLKLKILDKTQYFLVENTNKILVVKSSNILSLEMQKQKK